MKKDGAKKARKKPKKPAGWVTHAHDDLDPKALRSVAVRRGALVDPHDKSGETQATRARLRKLTKIAHLEREATGEEAW